MPELEISSRLKEVFFSIRSQIKEENPILKEKKDSLKIMFPDIP